MRPNRLAAALASAALLACAVVGAVGVPAASAQEKLPTAEIERIVRDYLMREPQVIYDAIQELQKRRDAESASRRKALIAERQDEIFQNPADPVGGNANGDVTLVEFFDYHCGYCRSMSPGLLAMIGHDKNLRFVFKELPVLGPDSVTAAKAALASTKQGKYAEFHFALMQSKDLSRDAVLALAQRIGLDRARLESEMDSDWVQAQLDANLRLAQSLGIDGTPSFVVGDQLVPGAAEISHLAQLVQEQRTAKD